MLQGPLLHPEILLSLASSGHGSKILIADGNFPFVTKPNPAAKTVFLNLSPGTVGVIDVLQAICPVTPIESAIVMAPPTQGEYAVQQPQIWEEFELVLRQTDNESRLEKVGRFNFYEYCASPDVSLVIATGEQRIFANLLLTVGVVKSLDN
ncbi:MAG: RbsD/FucU family protein [Planctomycetota bacterium]|nr:RbsD/FucU family protein [Planctomycetota bacterium]